eukprot:scaffold127827_cov27-Phaeocystis_antarctica.AAC.1
MHWSQTESSKCSLDSLSFHPRHPFINVWACQTPGYHRPRTGHTAKHHSRQQLATTHGSNRARTWHRRDDTVRRSQIDLTISFA